jgi:D-arabinose 1-dehydrogenase-like Zn-dependent alcohol dehydrogenase
MKAYRLKQWQHEPELEDLEVPEPGHGQVLIKVGGAGACHSDLHLMEWAEGKLPYSLPFTLGHENAGWVEKVGPGVEGLTPGDAVIVYGPWGCGYCKHCRLGMENYCLNAEKIGSMLQLAKDSGADHTLRSDSEAAAKIRDLTRGLGAEVVLDFVGADSTLKLAAKVARKLGHLTVVGLAGGTLGFNFFALPYECSVAAPYWGTLPDLFEVITLAEEGKLKPQVEYFSLARAQDAYRELRNGKLRGRAVIVPSEEPAQTI